jgi:hypothetical protein
MPEMLRHRNLRGVDFPRNKCLYRAGLAGAQAASAVASASAAATTIAMSVRISGLCTATRTFSSPKPCHNQLTTQLIWRWLSSGFGCMTCLLLSVVSRVGGSNPLGIEAPLYPLTGSGAFLFRPLVWRHNDFINRDSGFCCRILGEYP